VRSFSAAKGADRSVLSLRVLGLDKSVALITRKIRVVNKRREYEGRRVCVSVGTLACWCVSEGL